MNIQIMVYGEPQSIVTARPLDETYSDVSSPDTSLTPMIRTVRLEVKNHAYISGCFNIAFYERVFGVT